MVTPEEFAAFLDQEKPKQPMAQVVLDAAVEQVGSYCGRVFSLSKHTDLHSAVNGELLQFRQFPVVTIDKVSVAGLDKSAKDYTLVEGTTGKPDSLLGVFGRSVAVTYTAGYEEYPADLKLACMILAGHYYQKWLKKEFPVESESDGNLSRKTYGIPLEVINLLDSYRRRL